jgi:ABC-type multidrug transport system fused ATPase/permease subunit
MNIENVFLFFGISGFGYVAQIPWLQRGTIRDNILFGQTYYQPRYRWIEKNNLILRRNLLDCFKL